MQYFWISIIRLCLTHIRIHSVVHMRCNTVGTMQVQKVQISSFITCRKSLPTTTWLSCFRRSATFCLRKFTSTSKQILANVLVCLFSCHVTCLLSIVKLLSCISSFWWDFFVEYVTYITLIYWIERQVVHNINSHMYMYIHVVHHK